MKIIFIITGLGQGGAEAMLFKLLANIDQAKFKCVVISLLDMGVYGEKIVGLNIPVFCLNVKKSPNFVSCFKFINEFKPDIIQGWMYHANLFATFTKMISPSAKIAFNIRQSIYGNRDKISTRMMIKLNAWLSYFVKAVINNSIDSQKQHSNIGFSSKNEVHIPNGFDVDVFKPNSDIYKNFRFFQKLDINTKIIGNLARYHPMKNHVGLLTIFHKIKSSCSSKVILVLGGAGVDSKNTQLMDEIKRLELREDCILLGSVNAYEIMPVFDVYLSSSWGEAFPNVLGEAMACGIPCIATDVGDCQVIIDKFGAVAAVGDYATLAKYCIEKLSVSSDERQAMRKHVIDHYSIKNIVKQYENLYEKILKK